MSSKVNAQREAVRESFVKTEEEESRNFHFNIVELAHKEKIKYTLLLGVKQRESARLYLRLFFFDFNKKLLKANTMGWPRI